MANKYIYFDDTQKTLVEKEAITQSSGSGDAGKIVALHTDGKLHSSLMPTGIGADAITVPAYENLSAGDFVNIFLDSGTAKARKADATSITKRAVGFVLEAVSAGQNATVYKEGSNTALSGLSAGERYFLSTTAGGVSLTPPSGAGQIVQEIGTAVTSTQIDFEPNVICIRG
ncbi:MAG: hypothetical protein ACPLX7_10445 [Candidatus Kapaibacteriota bacterium]